MFKQLFARFSRKAHWMRGVYRYAFGRPTWSGSDYRAFMEEGLRKNPTVRAAKDYLADAAAAPAPVLYRVRRSGRAVTTALQTGYAHKSKKYQSRLPLGRIGRALLHHEAKAIHLMTGAPKHLCKREALKRLTAAGELEEIVAHPVLDLLQCPNPWTQPTFESFIDAQVMMLVMTGEIFIEPKKMAERS